MGPILRLRTRQRLQGVEQWSAHADANAGATHTYPDTGATHTDTDANAGATDANPNTR